MTTVVTRDPKFTFEEIGKRVIATFVQAATAALVAAGLTGETGTGFLVAGLTAVVAFCHRLSSRWLEQRGEL